ncbi:MAG: hypothetical protein C6W57_10645 [Caldibacillus debilis]|nr:MAG: hypothetical protein C6W57_10645 [Caldibacillus debilis]
MFAKYPAGGQGERCRHKGNGKPADMAVVGKTEAKTGSKPKTAVYWSPVLKLKNLNKKRRFLFCGPFHFHSLLSRQKNNSPKVPAAGLETDIKTFFNCARRFHVLSEFFHKNGVVIQNFLV